MYPVILACEKSLIRSPPNNLGPPSEMSSPNAPVIRDLREALIPWIIRVKPEGNTFLFNQVRQLAEQGLTEEFEETGSDGMYRYYRLAWNVPLNESNLDVRVDFLDVWTPSSQDPEQSSTFIIEPLLGLCRERAELLMRGGRSRWKIENECAKRS